MSRKGPEDDRLDQALGTAVELELDVMRLGGVHIEFTTEMPADEPPGGQGRLAGGEKKRCVHHQGNIRAGAHGRAGKIPI